MFSALKKQFGYGEIQQTAPKDENEKFLHLNNNLVIISKKLDELITVMKHIDAKTKGRI